MKLRVVVASLGFAFCTVVTATVAAQHSSPPASCPADPRLAYLVAESTMILIAQMNVPLDRLAAEGAKTTPSLVAIPLNIESVLKGSPPLPSIVRVYPQTRSGDLEISSIVGLSTKPALLFLTETATNPFTAYFTDASPDALRPVEEHDVVATMVEIRRQREIVRSFRRNATLPHFRKVERLIEKLGVVEDDDQQKTFDELVQLGSTAAPAIVAQMDNRRKLKDKRITLQNHAIDRFEETRCCEPRLSSS